MKPMDEAERARVASNIAAIKRDIPEFADFFKELFALGMVTGWRDVDYVGPPRDGPRGLTADQLVLESAADLKARMKHGNH